LEECSGEAIERYWTLFEEFQDAIVFLTGEAKVLDVNKACLDLLGYVREEIIGLDAARLLCAGPNGLHRLQSDIERCGSVRDYEMQFRRKDGKQIDCLVAATAWRDEVGLHGYGCVVRDVTARQDTGRSLRFFEEPDRMQTAVLSAISHEVRAPLAAIITSLSGLLASDGTLDQAAERQLLETADLEARRLHRLVDNLLSMTRLQTGSSAVKTEPCDLLDLVGAAVEELGTSAHQRKVSVDISEDLPLVPMDRELITHVLINLLSNAFKYSPPDRPVEVRGRIVDEELEVQVVDRGVGVPAEDIGRVFERFYRVAQLGSAKGLGLGLAICKAFIEAHGGRISLANNPKGGTIARFVIPLHA
jgi:PAS domain S-box-containing protein